MFAWLLLYAYVLGDVPDFVIVLFQNGVLIYTLLVSAWMLLHGYFLVDVLGFVIVLFQSGVFEHVFVFAWWLLYVYVLGDVLDFVIVLFQSGVFKYILVCSGWGGGLLSISAKRIDIRRENCFGGLKKLRGTFGNFNVPPRGFCQVWLYAYLSLEINMQQPTLTIMGCSGIMLHL